MIQQFHPLNQYELTGIAYAKTASFYRGLQIRSYQIMINMASNKSIMMCIVFPPPILFLTATLEGLLYTSILFLSGISTSCFRKTSCPLIPKPIKTG